MLRPSIISLCCVVAACGTASQPPRSGGGDTVVVYAASSLAVPMREALDSFARQTGVVAREEHGASLELARRITELQRVPDVIVLADQEVFPQLLVPNAASWYAAFAHNRMVVAYTDRSRRAGEMSAASWRQVLLRDDVLVGRTDPEQAPAGYRALLVYELAERHYGEPGLAGRLRARTPDRLLRGNAAELAALLAAGELDYIIEYESLARAQHFRFVVLPPELDLSDPSRAAAYARASVRVRRGTDTVTIAGAPILYGLSVPRDAPHRRAGERFAAFVMGPEGRAIMRRASVDAMDEAVLRGDSIPAQLSAARAP